MILAGISLILSSEDKGACVFRCAVLSTHMWQTCCLAHSHDRQNTWKGADSFQEEGAFPERSNFFAVCHQHESRWKNQPHPAGCRGASWGRGQI